MKNQLNKILKRYSRFLNISVTYVFMEIQKMFINVILNVKYKHKKSIILNIKYIIPYNKILKNNFASDNE